MDRKYKEIREAEAIPMTSIEFNNYKGYSILGLSDEKGYKERYIDINISGVSRINTEFWLSEKEFTSRFKKIK